MLPAAVVRTLLRFEPALVLCAALSISWWTFDIRVQQTEVEGDELVHIALADRLSHGSYSLRGTAVAQKPGFSAYLYDRAVHYNPPLYNLLLLGVRAGFGPTRYVYLSLLASAACAALVYRLTRRRSSPLAAAFAMLVFLGCPIVYLVSCRIWAEAVLALLICASAECCEQKRSFALALLLIAAALVKASVLFVVPGLCLFAPRDRKFLAVVLGVPAIISAFWLGYVYYQNLASPPAVAPIDDRFANAFVKQQAEKPALSLFYLPFLLNPGYMLAWLAWRRTMLPYALAVFGSMLAFSGLAWIGAGTYHTKYIGCVLPLLAVLAGTGFDALGQQMLASRRALVRVGLALVIAFALTFENMVHRRIWVAEVDPSLYLGCEGKCLRAIS